MLIKDPVNKPPKIIESDNDSLGAKTAGTQKMHGGEFEKPSTRERSVGLEHLRSKKGE